MAKFKVTSRDGAHDSLEPMRTQFAKNSVIFAEGDLGLAMYVIESGAVEIRKTLGGEERVLATLARGLDHVVPDMGHGAPARGFVLLVVGAMLAAGGAMPPVARFALLPGVVHALWMTRQERPNRPPIRRIGFEELAHTVVFVAITLFAYRG